MVQFTATLPVLRTNRYIQGQYSARGVETPPYPNPLVEKLRKKLKKQKLNFTEVSDGEFITFTTI